MHGAPVSNTNDIELATKLQNAQIGQAVDSHRNNADGSSIAVAQAVQADGQGVLI